VRRITQCLGALAAAALAAAGISAGPASAATQPTAKTRVQWRADIAHVRERGVGCYRASYPALQWHATSCVTAPRFPVTPAPLPRSARHAGPATVGNGTDYSAQVPGLISQATGNFLDVSSGVTEQGLVGGTGSLTANAFSLQLNSQFFSGSPACSGSSNPASCQAWQQFLYTYQGTATSSIYMQYWLINYDATCPSGWITDQSDCYKNSPAKQVTTLTAGQLATVLLSGSATSGGNDGVSMSVGSGQATLVTNSDSVLDLAPHWNTTEWGVYGDGGGSEANFGSKTTLQAQTTLTATTSSAPSCISEGFTAETNNLSLTSTPALGNDAFPTMDSRQTNGTTGTANCSTSSGTPPAEIAFQANNSHLWYYTATNAGHRDTGLGMAADTSPSIAASGEVAFQGANNHLWLYDPSTGGSRDTGLGMETGSSPAIVSLAGGGYEIAFQANTGILWLNDPSTGTSINTGLGMDKATSPDITATPSGSYEVAFQANNNDLWYYTPTNSGSRDTGLGMDAFTSPAITSTSSGSPEIAFQANNNDLWYWTPTNAGSRDTSLGMETFSSPAITATASGSPEIAFQANNKDLWYWTPTNSGSRDLGLGMAPGLDPAITAAPGGSPEIAFQANNNDLWYYTTTNAGSRDLGLGMAAGTSPAIQLGM
jgi:uncharacterized protein YneR